MSHESQAPAKLRAMIGDAIHSLNPLFVAKLEGILSRHEREERRQARVIRLAVVPAAADPMEASEDETATSMRRSSLAHVHRKLNALCATLETLHAAHLDQLDGLGHELPGEHIVEGLVVASRDLAESAREVLDRTQW